MKTLIALTLTLLLVPAAEAATVKITLSPSQAQEGSRSRHDSCCRPQHRRAEYW